MFEALAVAWYEEPFVCQRRCVWEPLAMGLRGRRDIVGQLAVAGASPIGADSVEVRRGASGLPVRRHDGGAAPAFHPAKMGASEPCIGRATTTSQIIHARLTTQATKIRIVCVLEKPWDPTTQPCNR